MKNNILITLNQIKQKYDQDYIINNFNYAFKQTGLYVLFGYSGSGKTTLLNIICGLTPFEEGHININGRTYEKKVDHKNISTLVGYVTQDNHFIDYLTAKENINVACNKNDTEIDKVLKVFMLEKVINQFPNQLSGGERQRLAMAITVLQDKKILILDEITSALDKNNKKIILQMLKNIKKDFLVIACSHDEEFKEYADSIINFNNLKEYNTKISSEKNHVIYPFTEKKSKSQNKKLFSFMFKNYKDKNREKKSSLFFVIIITIVLLISFLGGNEEKKILDSIVNTYNVNYLKVYCPITTIGFCQKEFENDKRIINYSYIYNENIPIIPDAQFEQLARTLPFESSLIKYNNVILYGKYYTETNQVILGFNYAINLAQKREMSLANLIGEKINLIMPDEEREFEVVGILNEIKGDFYTYLSSGLGISGDILDNYLYLNSDYTKKYINTDVFRNRDLISKNIVYHVYFKDAKSLLSFYNQTEKNINVNNKISVMDMSKAFIIETHNYEALQIYLYPIAIISVFLMLLFYFQTKRLEFTYKQHILSTYEYYGYKIKIIKLNYIVLTILEIIFLFIIALIFSIIMYNILNILNEYFKYMPFTPFLIDINNIWIILNIMLITSFIFSMIFLQTIKVKSWYQLLRDSRDLL